MIIWLASYPKSGNTLLRSILSSYFFSIDGEFSFENLYKITQFPLLSHLSSVGVDINNEKDSFRNFIKAQEFINKEKGNLKFFKTHSSYAKVYDSDFTNLKNTLGTIHIVRDPRNVVTSLTHHYDYTIDEAIETMINKEQFMAKTDLNAKVFIGSWSFNFNSWRQLKNHSNYLLIKYEDLINKKKTVMLKVLKFLKSLGANIDIDMIKLNRAIKSTEFKNMKFKEQKETFTEAVIDKKTGKRKNFFNLGPKNDWRTNLDKENRLKIEREFHKEMLELDYL